ncbi:carbonic anhydrase [Parendozoicomonas haliclonae]|uniref:Carbonic anhydrase n=1 Tax=Parendozoicomonas haliclonae TaxID=1960125 RepID=A0A1X7AE66_9GAMM|nr:carbonic anhydrase [Parendozoicomonas haliclonae]SMA32156.1 Carbonic anhydrase 2 [Parendozoicomonas haliclonae]
MEAIRQLLEQNRKWAQDREQQDPGCFARQSKSQAPKFLWIGCIDSRMPAEQLTGMEPGDMLVYRNIANQVNPKDTSIMAAIQFAVDALQIDHIVITGHTNCGGISAAIKGQVTDDLQTWLNPLQELNSEYGEELGHCGCHDEKVDHLCEINIKKQVLNVAETEVVQNAWKRGQKLSIHGCIYDVASGELRTMGIHVSGPDGAESFTF